MADELHVTVRSIHWRETFPFIHLFRAFRIAIHPSKLVLALAALVLLYAGGRVLDTAWPVSHRAVSGPIPEVVRYEQQQRGLTAPEEGSIQDFRYVQRKRIEADYAQMLLDHGVLGDPNAAADAATRGDRLAELKKKIKDERDDIRNKADADLAKPPSPDAKTARDELVHAAYDHAGAEIARAEEINNVGLFDEFFGYQLRQVSNIVHDVLIWDWTGEGGILKSIVRFVSVGPIWVLAVHPAFAGCFGVWFLLLWAIFGGAIARIAAVHVARDEKMSIRQALRFSVAKFLSFLFAPVIPLLIVTVIGLALTLGSLILGNIPFIGPILIGGLFFFGLAAGFVMTLVLLGLAGGFNLMYPTIAVEGSDSFDAISRSFSYLYARPWRLAFYSGVSVIYGALTYLFVRMFIFLMLMLTHGFIGFGILTHADNTAPLWQTMWPTPTARLIYTPDVTTLGPGQTTGAYLTAVWVYLTISMLGAFAISFYFSASTIIYYLMRREVDATELDDVHLEQLDDEFTEPATPAPVTASEAAVNAASAIPAATNVSKADAKADIAPPT